MAFPNAFQGLGGIGQNLAGRFPNNRTSGSLLPFQDIFNNLGPGLEEHLRRLAFFRDMEIQAQLEFRNRMGLPPGLGFNGGMFSDRDRLMMEREMELRDMRMRDEMERRRMGFDRDRGGGIDWNQERDDILSGRLHDRERDRSPVGGSDPEQRSSKYEDSNQDYGLAEGSERNNGGFSERFRNWESESHAETSRSMDGQGNDKWVSNKPERTILLRGMHPDMDERLIESELARLRIPFKEVRLIRRSSGVSRGFAFVEFHNRADAQRWMEYTQGNLVLFNHRASMTYSVTRDQDRGTTKDNQQKTDWDCIKCSSHNFKRRDFCFTCNLPRKESEKGKTNEVLDEIGTNPCNTLIFQGLDALTTEGSLVIAFSRAFSPSQLALIKNIVVVRDDLGTSRGFALVEFHTVAASTLVLYTLKRLASPLEVDGKQLVINYAKNTFNTTMAYIQQKQAQAQLFGQTSAAQTFSATGSASGTAQYAANAAAAVAHAAIQQAQVAKQTNINLKIRETVTVDGIEYPVYPPPDPTTYQYEPTSGFYYDPLTRFYYDAKSQYYFNATSRQYVYWDANKSTYLPAPTSTEGKGDASQGEQTKTEDTEEKKDKEKVKGAKKIAKEMEKWAKSLNAKKEAHKDFGKKATDQSGSPGASRQESATADAGFAILQKVNEDMYLMPPPQKPEKPAALSKLGLVASYGGDSDSGEEDDAPLPVDESTLVNWAKLACLLCKRQFKSKDILTKHMQASELHKQNLEALMKSKETPSVEKIEYRDRAKERRDKYGAPVPPEPQKRKDGDYELPAPEIYEEPTKLGIGSSNIGNKLLQKMGWSEGQGLGKSNQGRVDPIKAEQRNQMAGLGAKGATVVADVGGDYRIALKKTLFARYNELD